MRKRTIKNLILKTTAYIMGGAFLFFGCALDSGSYLPLIICCVSFAWLSVFAYANGVLNFKGWCDR